MRLIDADGTISKIRAVKNYIVPERETGKKMVEIERVIKFIENRETIEIDDDIIKK